MSEQTANPFGTPNYERPQPNALKYKKRKTLKVGSNRYRIMPPVHSLAATGQVFYWAALEYGYMRPSPKDADKLIPCPSKCILRITKRNGEREVLQECPECTLRYTRKQELEDLESKLRAEGKSKQEIEALTEPLRGWLKDHNKDSKYYFNAMNESGEFDLVAISGKCKAALDNLIVEIKAKYKLDPCSIDGGVWIDFVRTVPTGQTLAQCTDTPKIVMVQTTTEDGDIIERIKRAPLSADQLQTAAKECVDIPQMFTEYTYAQKKALSECSGDPSEVEAIVNLTQKADKPSEESDIEDEGPIEDLPVAPPKTAVKPETPAVVAESKTPTKPAATAAKAASKPTVKEFDDLFGEDE